MTKLEEKELQMLEMKRMKQLQEKKKLNEAIGDTDKNIIKKTVDGVINLISKGKISFKNYEDGEERILNAIKSVLEENGFSGNMNLALQTVFNKVKGESPGRY